MLWGDSAVAMKLQGACSRAAWGHLLGMKCVAAAEELTLITRRGGSPCTIPGETPHNVPVIKTLFVNSPPHIPGENKPKRESTKAAAKYSFQYRLN